MAALLELARVFAKRSDGFAAGTKGAEEWSVRAAAVKALVHVSPQDDPWAWKPPCGQHFGCEQRNPQSHGASPLQRLDEGNWVMSVVTRKMTVVVLDKVSFNGNEAANAQIARNVNHSKHGSRRATFESLARIAVEVGRRSIILLGQTMEDQDCDRRIVPARSFCGLSSRWKIPKTW